MIAKTIIASASLLLLAGCSITDIRNSFSCHPEEGFVPIFNGQNLEGWYGATNLYGVLPEEPGILQCLPGQEAADCPHGNLLTVKEYNDFILRFSFMMPENGNNGLGIRTPSPEVDAAYFGMCELQLLDDGGPAYYDAKEQKDLLLPFQYCCSPYGLVPVLRDAPKDSKDYRGGGSYLRPLGEWNEEEVIVQDSKITVYLNGKKVVDCDLSQFKGDGSDTPDKAAHPGLHNETGHIGFLGHGHKVKWCNIRIKEL